MSCTDNYCHDIGELLLSIRAQYEDSCAHSECTSVLLPTERKVLAEYVAWEFLDRRVMELARCFIQNGLRQKKDKMIKEFIVISSQDLTGRVNPERNILSQVRQCEKLGLDTLLSEARFLGSIATLLRTRSTPISLNYIRKILSDTQWRFKTSFNQVQQEAIDSLLKIFHHYIVGILCGNPVRAWSPNVTYVYGLYATKQPNANQYQFSCLTEKIPTLEPNSCLETLQVMLLEARCTPDLFLSILAQISLTLELLQAHDGFVHFHLRSDTLLMRPVTRIGGGRGLVWNYLVYSSEYTLRNIQFLATIQDFGYSCFSAQQMKTGQTTMDEPFQGMGTGKRYGIMDFMIPGYDLFSFLNDVRAKLKTSLDPDNTKSFLIQPEKQVNNLALLQIVDHILTQIFEAPDFFTGKAILSDNDLNVYNVLLCKGAGLSPLRVLEKLASDLALENGPLSALRLTVPWTIQHRGSFLPSAVTKKKIPTFLSDILPNWKTMIEEDNFYRPHPLPSLEELGSTISKLVDLVMEKRIFTGFDFRPLHMPGNLPNQEALDFYDRFVLDPTSFYHPFLENTLLYYNLLTNFLDVYYYKFHVKDEEYTRFFLSRYAQISKILGFALKSGHLSLVASIVRFSQTIHNIKKQMKNNNCCAATRQGLGILGLPVSQQQQQQKKSLGQQQSSSSFPTTPVTSPIYTLPSQTKQQQKQQQYRLPTLPTIPALSQQQQKVFVTPSPPTFSPPLPNGQQVPPPLQNNNQQQKKNQIQQRKSS